MSAPAYDDRGCGPQGVALERPGRRDSEATATERPAQLDNRVAGVDDEWRTGDVLVQPRRGNAAHRDVENVADGGAHGDQLSNHPRRGPELPAGAKDQPPVKLLRESLGKR